MITEFDGKLYQVRAGFAGALYADGIAAGEFLVANDELLPIQAVRYSQDPEDSRLRFVSFLLRGRSAPVVKSSAELVNVLCLYSPPPAEAQDEVAVLRNAERVAEVHELAWLGDTAPATRSVSHAAVSFWRVLRSMLKEARVFLGDDQEEEE